MPYDFDSRYDRRGQASGKWEGAWRTAKESGISLEGNEVPFTVADMEFRAAPEVCDALENLARQGLWGYTMGDERLKSVICGWFARRHNWQVREEWQVFTGGVVPALFMAVRSLTQKGDGVIIQPPVYHPFRGAVEAGEREVIENPLKLVDGTYRMDFEDLREKAKGAKMLILCSPHNPVSRVWEEEELRTLAEICLENNLLVFSDEIHCDLILGKKPHIPFANIAEKMGSGFASKLIIGTAASKSFSLAGLSTSSIVIPDEELRKAFQKECDKCGIHFNNSFGRAATIAAYEQGEPWLEELLAYLRGNRDWLNDYLHTNFPEVKMYEIEGTYLAWVDFSAWKMEQKGLMRFLWEQARVFVSDGATFGAGGEGCVRINIACPRSVLAEAMERLKKAREPMK